MLCLPFLLISPLLLSRGLYIGKYPPPWGGKYQPMSFGGKIWKGGEKKRGKCKKKEEREKKKEERGKGKKYHFQKGGGE
jgi:hypothetical protein